MTARLVALVMVPVSATCILAGSVVLSHQSAAARAVEVDREVSDLTQLAALRDALHDQQSVQEFEVRVAQLGITPEVATKSLGVDVRARVVPARGQADEAISALGEASPISAAALESMYTEIDEGTVSPAAGETRLAGVIDVIGRAMTSRLDGLDAKAHDASLRSALESLRISSEFVDLATPQGIDLSLVMFPVPGATPQQEAATLARLGEESANYAAAVAQLRELGVARVVATLERVETDPQVQAFEGSLAEILLGDPLLLFDTPEGLATDDVATIVGTFRGYLALETLLQGLVPAAASAVRDEARDVVASERAGLVASAAGAAALAVISIGVALWLGRSISRPLSDLAAYAQAIRKGRLDAEPPHDSRGIRETRVAFGAFADVVANLQMLDAKANALAHCDFDDPVLVEPLPGRLGRSLEDWVEVLSASIIERDQLQTNLAYEATHDSLTGIHNRPAAISAIQSALQRARRSAAMTALLYIDLTEFKAVNDSHGHEVGDEVLRQVAHRLSAGVRDGDFVARLGGDEFIVLAEGLADAADAVDLARRILHMINEPVEVAGARIVIGAAIGIALTLDGPEDPLRLLDRADAAMYRAKQHGGSGIEIFDADLQQQMTQREDIETALTAALADPAGGGLRLEYQPVLEARSQRLVGAEALIRWDRSGHGRLPPDTFIPIAEATALIIDVDCWVLSEAARQLIAWSADPDLAEIPVAVNISGRHLLSRQLPDHIRAILDETGIDPHRLTIEITETVLLADLATAADALDTVRALGVKVAIDDFGTGYTSLAHLQRLPIDTIKIDRSFVSQLGLRRGASLVRMVTDLGHAIDINVLAEGVETSDEMSTLLAVGADQLQGFLLSRPLRPADFETWAHHRQVPRLAASR